MRWAAVITALVLAIPAQAADIYVGRMGWGIPAIVIKGKIDFGDEGKFAAVAAMRQAGRGKLADAHAARGAT
jgi:hypothetical protein